MDTPAWVVKSEQEIIDLLISEADGRKLNTLLPKAVNLMRQSIDKLNKGQVPPSDLIVTQRLSREVDQFKGISASASAAKQMMAHHRSVRAGQKVEFIYTRGKAPNVQVVDYLHWPEDHVIDKQQYCKLLIRAVYQLLIPLGIQEEDMRALADEGIRQLVLFGG
jgi:DNA polymerase elongation subunit (family B)